MTTEARIFISYSRKDGASLAARVRQELGKQGFSIWQDLVAMEGGRNWWTQIEEALKSKTLQHLILILTPGALASPFVRREIRLARQEGKTISPVRGPDLGDLNKLPRWVGHVYDLDFSEQREVFHRTLWLPSQQMRAPMMAPEPPRDFVPRPREFASLKAKLLNDKSAVAITAALKGAGGYGKTTLAKALAHDADVEEAFCDGILWVELGEKPGSLLPILCDLVEILCGARPGIETINGAATKLGEALGDRRILLVVDDVWREQDLRPFLQGGRNTTRLITTRIDSTLPLDATHQPVDAMQADEALQLLAAGLTEQAATQQAELGKLAARLGKWALLLKLVNGFLRNRVLKGRQPFGEAIADVNKRLEAKGLVAFDARNEADRTTAVARTIGVSLDLLDENGRARFGELAVFPEDVDIPVSVVARLWRETSGLDELHVVDLLSELSNLSLLLNLDLDQKTLRLHDTVRRFLQEQTGKERLAGQHQRLLGALDYSPDMGAQALRYFYQHFPYHLAGAEERDRLDELLVNPGWLRAKLSVLGSPQALVADYEHYAGGEFQQLIGRTLRLTIGICARDPHQLIPQLMGRLLPFNCHDECSHFLDRARSQIERPTLLPMRPSLTPPGAEITRLEGHRDEVTALCALPDGRLASGSTDKTIRLWDLADGAETARIEGHEDAIRALCVLQDGRLASSSDDGTVRLWDLASGAEIARLEGYQYLANALCVLRDGRLASGSEGHNIRLWDPLSGAEAPLEGHRDDVTALCVLPDGRLPSASADKTIRLWDPARGAELAQIKNHQRTVYVLCPMPDGRLVSGSLDNTIWLWDLASGAKIAQLDGHQDSIPALCALPDGRLASGSDDCTIRLWDLTAGSEATSLDGHGSGVSALCTLPNGRLASGAGDKTIRLWDLASSAEVAPIKGHRDRITALCALPDGHLASGSDDRTIRLWDPASGAEIARLHGHWRAIRALCALPDGSLASGSRDKTIRLWNLASGAETAQLDGHQDAVRALCTLPDDRLASASNDKTIRLWDLLKGAETARLEGHKKGVTALCVLPDGRLASASNDKTIRLWDPASGAQLAQLGGHCGIVFTLCALPNGRVASGSMDKTIRLWDRASGAEVVRLDGHEDGVTALCALPDGRVASGSMDKTIRLWDPTNGTEITRLEADAIVKSLNLVVTNDGYTIVAGDGLGRLHWLKVFDAS